MKLAVIIPYFSYGISAYRDMLLRRLLMQLDHPRIDVFLSAVDVDVRAKMLPLGPTNRWEHVNLLPTRGGDPMWQKAFALNYAKKVVYGSRKDYFGLCLLDADADLDGLTGELVKRCEDMLRGCEGDEVIGTPFPLIQHNNRIVETAWARFARTSVTYDNSPRYSTAMYAQNPPGGCLFMTWGVSQWYSFAEWLPVGGDDTVFFSQIVGELMAKAVTDDEHVAPKLRPEPSVAEDQEILNTLYHKPHNLSAHLLVKASMDSRIVLPFANHGGFKAATYVSRHALTHGHTLMRCVDMGRVFGQPVFWSNSAPDELRKAVAEYMKSI